jgi:AcrR family transcriptional regulator
MVDTAVARPGGRTARTRATVLAATVAELVKHGYAALKIDSVATRAGVNKTTIYRRWSDKDSLIVDAIENFAAAQADVPDSGDIDEDLQLWARSILATLTGPVSGALVRAIFGGAGDSPQVRDLRHRFWLIRSTLVRPIVERAIERGQLPPDTIAEEVIKHVGAPLYYRLLVLDEPLTPEAARLAAATTAAAAHAGVFVPTETPTETEMAPRS